MTEVNYRFYPSLLNSFKMYIDEEGYENNEGEKVVFVSFDELINRINRVKSPPTEQMQKGNNFENDVLL